MDPEATHMSKKRISRICNSKQRKMCIIYFLLKYCIQIISPPIITTVNSSSKAFAQVSRAKDEAITSLGLEHPVMYVYIPPAELCKQLDQ